VARPRPCAPHLERAELQRAPGGDETPPIARHATRDMGSVNAEGLQQSAKAFLDEQCGFRRHGFPLEQLPPRGATQFWLRAPLPLIDPSTYGQLILVRAVQYASVKSVLEAQGLPPASGKGSRYAPVYHRAQLR